MASLKKQCSVPGCGRTNLAARGLCRSHYDRAQRREVLDEAPKRVIREVRGPLRGYGVFDNTLSKPRLLRESVAYIRYLAEVRQISPYQVVNEALEEWVTNHRKKNPNAPKSAEGKGAGTGG